MMGHCAHLSVRTSFKNIYIATSTPKLIKYLKASGISSITDYML